MHDESEADPEGGTPGGKDPFLGFDSILKHAGRVLPSQGPISIFVHHNTLHAFEDLPFEEAVVRAGRLFGCEPFLPEWRYREELASGRILDRDLVGVVEEELGPGGEEQIGGLATRREIRLAMLRHAIRPHRRREMIWLLEETDATHVLRDDLPDEARERILSGVRSRYGRDLPERRLERRAARRLWLACLGAAAQVPAITTSASTSPVRHRDVLLAGLGVDTDTLVHPILIRFCAAYLDQGLAQWAMPARERGMLGAFLHLYATGSRSPEPWLTGLSDLATDEKSNQGEELASILRSFTVLGVGRNEWETFTVSTLLALRGWAGMIRQLELRPDRAPVHAPPATLAGFLAIRLLLERLALAHVARTQGGYMGPLDKLRREDSFRPPRQIPRPPEERAFAFFHLAQCLGVSEERITTLEPAACGAILEEMDSFDDIARRRLFHLAYERRHAMEVIDALAAHARDPMPAPPAPAFQAVFCIDEREESFRRHLEEVEPACETFGVPGFFGVAMNYRALDEERARPLCPIAILPRHEVVERAVEESPLAEAVRRGLRRTSNRARHEWSQGTRNPARGSVLAATFGILAAIPLVLRVLFPRWAARVTPVRLERKLAPRTRLLIAQQESSGSGSIGDSPGPGFSVAEMAGIVQRLIQETGVRVGACPVVLIVGHGSTSLNNPHESAHDCGACGGGQGGPNARAFAQMANNPRVRAALLERGVFVPDGVRFLGAYHDTCNDAIDFFDMDEIPEEFRGAVDRIRTSLDEARARNAHERSRRFEHIPPWFPPALALAHVEDRAEDLAQPRPEYGHATNAVCIVGRRRSTRGLFLDRRAFLVSYDPTQDDEEGSVLARILASSVPVGAGINLEYFFSSVDPYGYGCHTKLPQNVSGLLGVMDGHRSDLRPGLPWQMVEIHEPLRLLFIVECEPELLLRVLRSDPNLWRLVHNRWIRTVAWRTDSDEFIWYEKGRFVSHKRESLAVPEVARSVEWYRNRRDHLPVARIRPFRGGEV